MEVKSFNPSQVQFTPPKNITFPAKIISFNPSQVQFTPNTGMLKSLLLMGFNPSQVQFTHKGICGRRIKRISVSIPHRFNSHKAKGGSYVREITRFNPSQVQFTLTSTFTPKYRISSFQSLTGSIHTNLNRRR